MQQINMRPISVLLVLGGLALIFVIVFGLLGAFIAHLFYPEIGLSDAQNLMVDMTPDKKNFLIIVQVVASIGGFFLSIWAVSTIFVGYELKNLLPLNKFGVIKFIAAAIFIFLGMQIIINVLHDINGLVPFSESLLAKEKMNLQMQEVFIKGNTIWDLLISVAVVGLLPALVEEMFFRGALQKLFYGLHKNVHFAVWMQAALFGLIHFNATQVLPIMAIGVLFGYMAFYSQSLVYGIIVHFLNNTGAVLLLFYKDKTNWVKYLDTENSLSPVQYAIGIAALLVGLYLFFMFQTNKVKKDARNY